jgi:hypothetical protein
MNYNRRSTRPDGLFYREQRKIRGSMRSRAGQTMKPAAIFIVAILLVALVYYVLHR